MKNKLNEAFSKEITMLTKAKFAGYEFAAAIQALMVTHDFGMKNIN